LFFDSGIAMQNTLLKNVVIVGGGTAGWMTAAALSKILGDKIALRLIESDEISTVGVGEATIPMIRRFNEVLQIDENEFMRETQGTIKLAIEFVNWSRIGHRYMHAFGKFGQDLQTVDFYQYWLKMRGEGKAAELGKYSINEAASHQSKFMRATNEMGNSPLADIVHAFHFDAGLYAQYLRKYSEARGVTRTEGKIMDTVLRAADGHIEAVVLESGERIEGELFIDCSGFRGLLIEGALKAGYEDWSHWLPCDRAIAVPCERQADLLTYTRSIAHSAGWQWRIGLQHRTGNGHVYASNYMSQDEATAILMSNLDGKPLAEPRQLKFVTGKRKKVWVKNCVAIGLSSGFLEPLESTSIHMIQSTIARLVSFFPDQGFSQTDIDEFNRQADFEYERIRDFIILHYKASERTDSPFWLYCRDMEVPATLKAKMDLFQSRGRIVRENNELFSEVGWLQVMHGQGLRPQSYNPLVDLMGEQEILNYLGEIEDVIQKCADYMPTHVDFIKANCAAKN
jgi:tryptophan halogenase